MSKLFVLVVGLITLASGTSSQAQQVDPEWPCIQALIPEVALAVLWPNPMQDNERGKWKDDPDVAKLAQTLGDIEMFTEQEEQIIDDFAIAQQQDQLTGKLNNLADGVVEVANKLRARYIDGIKRYTRQQISIAAQVEDSLNKLAAMGDTQSPERSELEASLLWHERVYDQRERAIVSLCERPVELEEKLSSVLRHLSSHLP